MKKTRRIIPLLPLMLFFSSSLVQAHEVVVKEIQSRSSAPQAQGWLALVWKVQGSDLTVTNTSQSPIHLGRDVKLMPDEMPLTLIKTTLQPGETLPVFGACPEHLPLQKEVIITLSDKNAQQGVSHRLPINH